MCFQYMHKIYGRKSPKSSPTRPQQASETRVAHANHIHKFLKINKYDFLKKMKLTFFNFKYYGYSKIRSVVLTESFTYVLSLSLCRFYNKKLRALNQMRYLTKNIIFTDLLAITAKDYYFAKYFSIPAFLILIIEQFITKSRIFFAVIKNLKSYNTLEIKTKYIPFNPHTHTIHRYTQIHRHTHTQKVCCDVQSNL